MSGIRLASLALVVGAAACMSDSSNAPQYPQPVGTAPSWDGPPGGGMDPGTAYPQQEADGSYGGYESSYPPSGDDPTAASEDPADPNYALGDVTDTEISATLEGQGEWVEDEDYGQVWVPNATVVGEDFTPYDSSGQWVYTDYGWSFDSEYAWGWLPFHYGNWFMYDDGAWGWAPGHHWGSSWCEWRDGNGTVGWRPLAPTVRDHRPGGRPDGSWASTTPGSHIRDHRTHSDPDRTWHFAAQNELGLRHRPTSFAAADGLRSTVPVVRPAAGAFGARASSLMNNRVRSATWQRMYPQQPRSFGNRSFNGGAGPRGGARPWQGAGELGQSTAGGRTWQRPPQGYDPRTRTGAAQQPTWQYNRRPSFGANGTYQQPQPYRGPQRGFSGNSTPSSGYYGGSVRPTAPAPTWGGSYGNNNRAPQRTWVAPRPSSPPSWGGNSGGSRPSYNTGGAYRAPSRPSFNGGSYSGGGSSGGRSSGGGGSSAGSRSSGGGSSSGSRSSGGGGGSRSSGGGGGRHR